MTNVLINLLTKIQFYICRVIIIIFFFKLDILRA